jgi:hypothetical protein
MAPIISLVRNMQLKKQYFLGFQLKKGPSGGPKRVSIKTFENLSEIDIELSPHIAHHKNVT